MKKILIVSDDEKIASHLSQTLSMRYDVMDFTDEASGCPDLVLVIAPNDAAAFFHMREKLGFNCCEAPVFFLWVEDECFHIISWGELRNIESQVLPKCEEHLIAYIDSALSEDPEQNLTDIQSEIRRSYQSDQSNGALEVSYDDFASIYQFVEKMAERSGQCVQTLLLTLIPQNGSEHIPERLLYARKVLFDSIHVTLRKNDVLTGCSNSQILVLLMDADDDGGHLATNRILNNFLGSYDDDAYELHYDIRPVGMCK